MQVFERGYLCFLIVLGAIAVVTPGIAQADTDRCHKLVASGNPDYPPYLWRNLENPNELIGANADFMDRLSREIGIHIDVIYVGPWGRVQEEARSGKIDLIAGAFLTLPRMEYMDYVHPPFQGTETVIWTPENYTMAYQKWDDLIGLEGLTVINNSFGQAFDTFARQSLTIRETPNLEQALRMLSLSRADYLIYEEYPGAAYVARYNIEGIRAHAVPVSTEDLYITLSHQSPCNNGALRGRLAQAVFKLVQEDVMTEMIARNVARWGSDTN
ncbi:ABC transporter substrate-binding protein [Thalassospira sp.]|uniref:substrate-binding periplasmic protein n=1 Tax=Thalassospira sp. TaxID=1912094 RepID=UPI002733BD03|nr:transporter substrate-binding domain-containing protein [Thalassospira sp.]MDP2698974.1 transporter substrate-binding domain-containing protein [Thalassospira sp.]